MKRSVPALDIRKLSVAVGDKPILHGVSFAVGSGEIHAVMGPNGSGKSTLTLALMGHPAYTIGKGSAIRLSGKPIAALATEDRANSGLFLAFQSPMAIPGVTVTSLLRAAYAAKYGGAPKTPKPAVAQQSVGDMPIGAFMARVRSLADKLGIDQALLARGINDGFSGGERKKMELLQALVLAPKAALFDEIDTGLDVDALKVVAAGIRELADGGCGVVVVTHYQRILKYLSPDAVHVLVAGRMAEEGGPELARRIENEGYRRYRKAAA